MTTDASSTPSRSDSKPDAFEAEGRAVLFGFPATRVRVTLRRRSRGWRVGGAARTVGVSVLVAPVVALLPPHAIWPIGALVAGGVLAHRRFNERFTLLELEGACPKCEAQLHVKGGRLRQPHPLPCDVCHFDSALKLPTDVLESGGG